MLDPPIAGHWQRGQLSDVVGQISAGTSVNAEDRPVGSGEIGVLKTSCIARGLFRPSEHKAVIHEETQRVRTPVRSGAIIICRKNTPELVGMSAYVGQSYPHLFLPDLLWQIMPRSSVEARWLGYVLAASQFRKKLMMISSGTSLSMRNISMEEFLRLSIEIPPRIEQRRIAEILRAWDEAIEKMEKQIAFKEREFFSLSESLLRGTRQFGGNRSHWPEVKLRDVTQELSVRNSRRYGRQSVKGVNKIHGMIPMKDHVIACSLQRYKIVPPNAFAYNPMRLNIGSIAMNEFGEDVLVSPDYVVFEAIPQALEPRFLNYLRRSAVWTNFVGLAGTGSVRVRIYYDDLAALKFRLPPVDQQERIADFLDVAAREIEILGYEASALAAQKRGLMQKLLTGEWPVDSDIRVVREAKEVAE